MGGKDKWTYTLNEPRQGSVAVRLRLGDMDGWCADAPALAQGKPPSTAKSDRPDLFKSQRNAPASAVCPAVPAGGFASGAFLDQEGTRVSVRRGDSRCLRQSRGPCAPATGAYRR